MQSLTDWLPKDLDTSLEFVEKWTKDQKPWHEKLWEQLPIDHEVKPWLDEWIEHLRPYCAHFVNLEKLAELKDKCCFSTFYSPEVKLENTNEVQLGDLLLPGGCIGVRQIKPLPVGEDIKTAPTQVFFCKDRHLDQVILNFDPSTIPTDGVTFSLYKVPAGANATVPPVLEAEVTVTESADLPVVFKPVRPQVPKHQKVPDLGFDYFLTQTFPTPSTTVLNPPMILPISDLYITLVCGPLKCTQSKTTCCFALLEAGANPLGQPELVSQDGLTISLKPLAGTKCACIGDSSKTFDCCSCVGSECGISQLDQVALNIPIEINLLTGSIDVVVELQSKGQTVVTTDPIELTSKDTRLTAVLDPSEHFFKTFTGPWSIHVTPSEPDVLIITTPKGPEPVGIVGLVCANTPVTHKVHKKK